MPVQRSTTDSHRCATHSRFCPVVRRFFLTPCYLGNWLIASFLSEKKIDSIDRRLQQVIELLSHTNIGLALAHGDPSYDQFTQATHGLISPEIPAPSIRHALITPQILFEEDSTISTDAALAHSLLETAVHKGPLKDYRSETMDTLRALVGGRNRTSSHHGTANQHAHSNPMRPLSSVDTPMPPAHTVMKALQIMKGESEILMFRPITDIGV